MDQTEVLPSLPGVTGSPGDLIPLLQWLQKRDGYISQEGVRWLARWLKVSENHIYGVASFYTPFRFTKPGENRLRVCQGTACHVQGGEQLSKEVHKRLGVTPGQTTPDGRIQFEEVACLGCCAQAAVVELNGRVYARMTPGSLTKLIVSISQPDGAAQNDSETAGEHA